MAEASPHDLGRPPERLQDRFSHLQFEGWGLGERDLFEALGRAWPNLGWDGTPQALMDYWFEKDSRLNHGVLAMLDAWRAWGGPAVLSTKREHHRARHVWEARSLRPRFDGVVCSAASGARKPDPRFFEPVMGRLPARRSEQMLFEGDSAANVAAARAMGWRARQYGAPADLHRLIASS
jgi:putative hydrolase of the HAD superfamily